ncbi:MAG: helicase HerA domain-containing protein [Candidatus Bathyarchaeia archaeon]
MHSTPWFHIQDLIGRKTLILGEVGSGKTRLTAEILKEAVETLNGREVTVIDMAPPPILLGRLKVGGRLREYTSATGSVRYLWDPGIKPPRLSSKTPEEVLESVRGNKAAIDAMLDEYLRNPSRILVVNDASIYLQVEPFTRLFEAVEAADTVVANGYYGRAIRVSYDAGISEVERRGMQLLMRNMDRLIYLR